MLFGLTPILLLAPLTYGSPARRQVDSSSPSASSLSLNSSALTNSSTASVTLSASSTLSSVVSVTLTSDSVVSSSSDVASSTSSGPVVTSSSLTSLVASSSGVSSSDVSSSVSSFSVSSSPISTSQGSSLVDSSSASSSGSAFASLSSTTQAVSSAQPTIAASSVLVSSSILSTNVTQVSASQANQSSTSVSKVSSSNVVLPTLNMPVITSNATISSAVATPSVAAADRTIIALKSRPYLQIYGDYQMATTFFSQEADTWQSCIDLCERYDTCSGVTMSMKILSTQRYVCWLKWQTGTIKSGNFTFAPSGNLVTFLKANAVSECPDFNAVVGVKSAAFASCKYLPSPIIQVISGDSCYGIASKYNLTVAALQAYNPALNSDCSNIAIGQSLCLNSNCASAIASGPDTSKSLTLKSQTYIMATGSYQGDNSVTISTKTFATWQECLDLCDSLVSCSGFSVSSQNNTKGLYTCSPKIRNGTLAQGTWTLGANANWIAVIKSTPTDGCKEFNSVLKPNMVAYANCQSLGVPTTTVQSGNDCTSIAASAKLTVDDLIYLNPGLNCALLQIGQSLCLSVGCLSKKPSTPIFSVSARATPYLQLVGEWQPFGTQNLKSLNVPDTQSCVDACDYSPDCSGFVLSALNNTVDPASSILCTMKKPVLGLTQGIWNYTYTSTKMSFIKSATNFGCSQFNSLVTPLTAARANCQNSAATGVVVRDGDSCSSLMAQAGVSLATFASWNPSIGSDCSKMFIGQRLCLTANCSLYSPATLAQSNYTVVAGDTCPAIAAAFNTTKPALMAINPLLNLTNCLLSIGQNVCLRAPDCFTYEIPASVQTYRVQPGETCATIQNKAGVAVQTLIQYNPSVGANCLVTIGQLLCLRAASCLPAQPAPGTYSLLGNTTTSTSKAVPATKYRAAIPGYLTSGSFTGSVSWSFDDGPFNWETNLTRYLDSVGAKGSFFVNGNNAACIYDEDNVKQLRATYAAGHLIGSHTWSHYDISKYNNTILGAQLDMLETALWKILGVKPALFRPPYGAYSKSNLDYLNSRGYTVVGWNVDTQDALNSTVQASANAALLAQSASMVLGHEIVESTVFNVVPQVVPQLQAKGLKFVTINEQLGIRPYQVTGGAQQARDATWTCDNTPESDIAYMGAGPST